MHESSLEALIREHPHTILRSEGDNFIEFRLPEN